MMAHCHICRRWDLHPYLLCQVLFLELLRQGILQIYPNGGHPGKCPNCGYFCIYPNIGYIAIIQLRIICNYPNCGYIKHIPIAIGDDDGVGGEGGGGVVCGGEGVSGGGVGGEGIAAFGAAVVPSWE